MIIQNPLYITDVVVRRQTDLGHTGKHSLGICVRMSIAIGQFASHGVRGLGVNLVLWRLESFYQRNRRSNRGGSSSNT